MNNQLVEARLKIIKAEVERDETLLLCVVWCCVVWCCAAMMCVATLERKQIQFRCVSLARIASAVPVGHEPVPNSRIFSSPRAHRIEKVEEVEGCKTSPMSNDRFGAVLYGSVPLIRMCILN